MKKILVLCGAVFCAVVSAAPAPNTYDVEVLVFENRLPELDGGELWTRNGPNAGTPDLSGTLLPPGETVPADAALSAVATTLQRAGTYRVLVHERWRQTAEEKSASKAVRLRNTDGQLDGTLRFYMARFLHVDVDLLLQEQTTSSASPGFRLVEHRRIKTQETNYFDHPKLGVLVRITAAGKE